MTHKAYLEVFQCLITILASDINPKLKVVILLVGEKGLSDESIEDDLALNVQEGCEYGCPLCLLSSEEPHVLGHQALKESARIRASHREHSPLAELGDPATCTIELLSGDRCYERCDQVLAYFSVWV